MANKLLRKIGMGMTILMTASQLSSVMVYAAPEDDNFGDRLEEQYEAEAIETEEKAETEGTSLDVEEEDIDNVELSVKELIPPINVEWDRPGFIKFKIASETPMHYYCIVKKTNGKTGSEFHYGDLSKYYGQEVIKYIGQDFDRTGKYSFRIGVCEDVSKTSSSNYSEWSEELEWVEPEERVSTPTNLHWEKIDDTQFAIGVCDPIEHAELINIYLWKDDGEYVYVPGKNLEQNKKDFSEFVGDFTEHEYYFDVRAYSNDLTKYANSLESEKSPIYSPDTVITVSGDVIPESSTPRIIENADGTAKVYQNGKEVTNYTGLAQLGIEEDASWVYVKDGKRDQTFKGYVDYADSKFYVENGNLKTDLNGVMIDGEANPLVWYFCSNGQVQTQHVGLAEYDGAWFYIENGKVATDMNAFVDYNGGKFAVGAGRIIKEYSGLMQDPQNPQTGDWYYFADGQAQTQYTGLAMYDDVWFYVVNGKLAQDYTGNVDYDGSTFYVENGMVK